MFEVTPEASKVYLAGKEGFSHHKERRRYYLDNARSKTFINGEAHEILNIYSKHSNWKKNLTPNYHCLQYSVYIYSNIFNYFSKKVFLFVCF